MLLLLLLPLCAYPHTHKYLVSRKNTKNEQRGSISGITHSHALSGDKMVVPMLIHQYL